MREPKNMHSEPRNAQTPILRWSRPVLPMTASWGVVTALPRVARARTRGSPAGTPPAPPLRGRRGLHGGPPCLQGPELVAMMDRGDVPEVVLGGRGGDGPLQRAPIPGIGGRAGPAPPATPPPPRPQR